MTLVNPRAEQIANVINKDKVDHLLYLMPEKSSLSIVAIPVDFESVLRHIESQDACFIGRFGPGVTAQELDKVIIDYTAAFIPESSLPRRH